MNNYIGEECPVCKEKFRENDDIVVCPKCGAPHHKECYNKAGKCVFDYKHEEDYTWEPSHISQNSGEGSGTGNLPNKVCHRCGAKNPGDAIFCNKCGMPFNIDIENEENPYASLGGQIPILFDPLGGVNENETIKGIKAKDIAKFVKGNTPYYLNVFKRLKDLNVGRFNFCGFLFSGAWMLYRKQYKLGAVFTSIVAMCMILNSFITYNYTQPLLMSMINEANIDMSSASIRQISEVLSQNLSLMQPSELTLIFIPLILEAIKWFIMFFVGFRGNRMYFNHTIKKITEIKTTSSSQAVYSEKLEQKGGVNTQLAICLFICYLIINWLPQFLI